MQFALAQGVVQALAAVLGACIFTSVDVTQAPAAVRTATVDHGTNADAAVGRTFATSLDTLGTSFMAAALSAAMGPAQTTALTALVATKHSASHSATVGLAQTMGLHCVATGFNCAALGAAVTHAKAASSGLSVATGNLT
ncbi:Aste57867_5144 [Aphanomyces stellatus]|uniref:Aste57867_5144 protein n=1 Tax=Aphanomyces stellatus TaxID=120398 RepID=A0A485KH57_9STRA|nr:hypothetical protein As57867_005131 [Aphanomyces stellatus]VFT82222.1 Aste57867_5144 [Aphanomyces stellatus]